MRPHRGRGLFSQLQDVDGWKIRGGMEGVELPVLLERSLLLRIEGWFDTSERFKSAGSKCFDDLFNRASVGFSRSSSMPLTLKDRFQLQAIAVSGCMSVRKTVAPGRVIR